MQSLVHCTMGKRSPPTPAKYQTFKSAGTEGNDSGMFNDIVEGCSFMQICGSRVETGDKDEKWFLSIKEAITRRVPTPSGEVDSLISPKQF